MTEPSVYAEEVSKLKDPDELKQACIGLKDTNRYFSSPRHADSVCPLHPGLCSVVNIAMIYKKCVAVNRVMCRSARFPRNPLEVSELLNRLR